MESAKERPAVSDEFVEAVKSEIEWHGAATSPRVGLQDWQSAK